MDKMQIQLAKVIENYFGADAWYLDISCLDLAKRILDEGWEKPVRCKDCVNYCGFERCKNGICDVDSVSKRAVYPNDFCSYGERRNDD